MAWRQSVATKFVFNASEPVNQNDLMSLKARIANRKVELDRKIRSSAAVLQQTSSDSLTQRAKIASLANQAFATRKQAEINEQSATGPLHKASKVVSLCCIGLAAIGLLVNNGPTSSPPPEKPPVVVARTPERPPSRPELPLAISKNASPAVGSSPRMATSPPIDLQSPKEFPSNNSLPQQEAATTITPMVQESREPHITSQEVPAVNVIRRQLTKADDAIEVQKRLSDLGFFSGPTSGKWGPQSKRALLEYKSQAGLEKNDVWDAATESSLFSEDAPHAARNLAFIGGWSVEQGECGGAGEPAPLRIMANRAETDGGVCQFNAVRPDGSNAWRIDAMCSVNGISHLAHIRLAVKGSVLHWTSEQPEALYYRCENLR